jgi:hypothetical protein
VVCVPAKSICSCLGLAFGMLSSSPPPAFFRVFFVLQSFNLPSSLASQKDAPPESLSRLALRYDTFIFFPEIFVSFGSSSGDRGGDGSWPAGGEDAPRHTAIAAAHCFAVSYL